MAADTIIRRATSEDLQAVVTILGSHWPQLGSDPAGMAATYERRMAEGDRLLWVADHSGRLTAAAVVDLNTGRRPRVIATEHGEETPGAILEKLVVLEDVRGRQLGTRMQDQLLGELAAGGCCLIALDVESGKPRAFAFWQQSGWTHVADEQNPGPGEAYRHVFIRRLA